MNIRDYLKLILHIQNIMMHAAMALNAICTSLFDRANYNKTFLPSDPHCK